MIKKIFDITTTVIVILVVVFAFLLVGVRLFGLMPYTVLSGSMEPTYHVGSLIYVEKASPAELDVGVPITYVINGKTVVTHRIVEVVEEDGVTKYRTKGDANEDVDGTPVPYENIIGKPVFTIPFIGYVAYFVQNSPGNIIVFSILGVLLILTFVPDIIDKVEKVFEDKPGEESPDENNSD